jgi:hypothetical protein
LNGRKLVDTVGGNGLAINYDDEQSVRVWGYPAKGKYNRNKKPYYCDARSQDAGWFDPDVVVACGFTQGASGGPWLINRIDANVGYIFAVTSRMDDDAVNNYATPNKSYVLSMFKKISGKV